MKQIIIGRQRLSSPFAFLGALEDEKCKVTAL